MLFTLPVFYSWLLGPSEVLWLKLPGCCTRILFFNYILLGHKRSLGGILSCCWVRWSCGSWSLPVTWFSWSSKVLTRIVTLSSTLEIFFFVLTAYGCKIYLETLYVESSRVFLICFLVWRLSCCFLILGVFLTLVWQSIYTTCKIYLKTLSAMPNWGPNKALTWKAREGSGVPRVRRWQIN